MLAVYLISTAICISRLPPSRCVPNASSSFDINNPFFSHPFTRARSSHICSVNHFTNDENVEDFSCFSCGGGEAEKQMGKLRSTALNMYQHLIIHQLVFLSSRTNFSRRRTTVAARDRV